jgi:hypothetical protein
LTIENADIVAAGFGGAGIGSGIADGGRFNGSSVVREIAIRNSRITATGTDAAGIGSGTGKLPGGLSEVTQIRIAESAVTAAGSNGAGIGTGQALMGGTSSVGAIALVDGRFDVNSSTGPGIGSVGNLTLSGNISLRVRTNAQLSAIDASSSVLSQLSLRASTPGRRVFGSTPAVAELRALLLLYGSVSDAEEPLRPLGVPVLQIGEVKLPQSDVWRLCAFKSDYSNRFVFNSSQFRSFAVSLTAGGTYHVNASTNSSHGHLEHDANDPAFSVSGHAFFDKAEYMQEKASSRTIGIYLIIGGVVSGVAAIAIIIVLGVGYRRRTAAAHDATALSLASGLYTEAPVQAPKSSSPL